jgi:hypothetical protein
VPSLANHQSNEFTKLLIEGDSGSGKTGALASLVAAGFYLRILDMDNGLDVLKQFILRDSPDKIDNVEYRTLRDKYKSGPEGPVIAGTPKAFVDAVKLLDRWKYTDGGSETDLGVPSEWGSNCILVIDSLTFLSDAAFAFREPLAPRGKDGKHDARAVYKDAQDAIESVLAFVTGESFRTNVIVTSHIRYIENPDGSKKGYPTSVGSALGPIIPRYFNSVALCENKNGKRQISTVATAMIDLKNPKPFDMAKSYPIDTGLAEFFGVLRATPKVAEATKVVEVVKPKALTLARKI